MPHESTVGHEDKLPIENMRSLMGSRSRASTVSDDLSPSPAVMKRNPLERMESLRFYAETPRQFTQLQDEDDDSADSKEGDAKHDIRELTPPDEEYDEYESEQDKAILATSVPF